MNQRRITMLAAAGIMIACGMCPAPASAAIVVNWGEQNYVSTDQPLSNLVAGSHLGGFDSNGDALKISPTSGYSGGNFYGAIAWTGGENNVGHLNEYATSYDNIELKQGNHGATGADLDAVILWRQSDFLNGGDAGNVTFDATSSIAVRLQFVTDFDAAHVVIRLQGGSHDGYYISQEAPFSGTSTHTVSPIALTWLAYDPATSLATFGPSVNLLDGGEIQHVTAVGMYTHSDGTADNAFRLRKITVDAVVTVPEPAAAMLMIGAAGGALLMRRRRLV